MRMTELQDFLSEKEHIKINYIQYKCALKNKSAVGKECNQWNIARVIAY